MIPIPGFPMEGRAATACNTATITSGGIQAPTFQFRPYDYDTSNNATVDEDAPTFTCRNRFPDRAVAVGDEMSVIMDANGIGVIVVWLCGD